MTLSGVSPISSVAGYVPVRSARFWRSIVILQLSFFCSFLCAAEPAKKLFDLPSDRAEKSLKLFSRQAGLEVIFPSEIAKEVRTNPVKGKMTAREALDAMLANTGLVLFEDSTGAFTVRREGRDPNGQRAAQNTPSDRPTNPDHPKHSKNPRKP